jgi:hypothetical protein
MGFGEVLVPLAFFAMVVGLVIGYPLAKAYARRMDASTRDALPSGDVITRLERIEQAIEAMATEVERITEGQRFTTKLLAEPRANAQPALAAPAAPQEAREHTEEGISDGTILSKSARRT